VATAKNRAHRRLVLASSAVARTVDSTLDAIGARASMRSVSLTWSRRRCEQLQHVRAAHSHHQDIGTRTCQLRANEDAAPVTLKWCSVCAVMCLV